MSAGKPREHVVLYWWSSAQETLNAARRDLAAGDYRLAVGRLYYALFYAASAVLLEEGHKFTKHTAVRAAFNQEIIRTGRLSRGHAQLYNQLFDDRLEGDYAAFAVFDEAYVQEQLRGCETFLRDIRPLLRSLPPEGEADGQD